MLSLIMNKFTLSKNVLDKQPGLYKEKFNEKSDVFCLYCFLSCRRTGSLEPENAKHFERTKEDSFC